MIEENGRSRVYLGVHWVFDAFAVDEDNELDLDKLMDGKPIGGVPLGLEIAKDIFAAGGGKGPKKPEYAANWFFSGSYVFSIGIWASRLAES